MKDLFGELNRMISSWRISDVSVKNNGVSESRINIVTGNSNIVTSSPTTYNTTTVTDWDTKLHKSEGIYYERKAVKILMDIVPQRFTVVPNPETRHIPDAFLYLGNRYIADMEIKATDRWGVGISLFSLEHYLKRTERPFFIIAVSVKDGEIAEMRWINIDDLPAPRKIVYTHHKDRQIAKQFAQYFGCDKIEPVFSVKGGSGAPFALFDLNDFRPITEFVDELKKILDDADDEEISLKCTTDDETVKKATEELKKVLTGWDK